jgi:uncharacterized membrane protein HdeD (DUF308 family)
MLALMAKNWWVIALRGVAAILFGILTIGWPQISLLGIIYLFGAYALVDGISSILAAVRGDPPTRGHGLLIAIIGFAGVIAGLIAFVNPSLTALTLLYVIGAWAIVVGVTQVYAAYRLRKEIEGEWLLAIGGIASVAFGILVLVAPGAGALSVLALIATFAIIFGVSLLALAWRLRKLHNAVSGTGQRTTGTSAA